MAVQWYNFSTTGGADPLLPSNYTAAGATKPACPGSSKICAILADADAFGQPDITQPIINDMVRALQFGSDQSTVALRT